MLKVKEGIELEELEKYGFKRKNFADGNDLYIKEYRDYEEVRDCITVFCKDRTLMVAHAIYMLDTLYDLITAGIVVKE